MRFGFAIAMLLVLLNVVFPLAALAAVADETVNVRALDPWASEALERGRHRSALVRELLDELGLSDLIVHVETSSTLTPGLAGMTRFVAAAGEYRYARVTVHRDLSPDVRAATLAHELQHAVELARARVRTPLDVLRLYLRDGYRTAGQQRYYETDAAQRAGLRAWMELHDAKPAAAQQQ